MNKLCYLLILISFSFTNTCMAANKSSRQLLITSEPSGAEIYIDGKHKAATPRSFVFSGNRKHRIVVRKEGYLPRGVVLKPVANGFSFLGKMIYFTAYPLAGASLGVGAGYLATGGSASGCLGWTILYSAGLGLVVGLVTGLAAIVTIDSLPSAKKPVADKINFVLDRAS